MNIRKPLTTFLTVFLVVTGFSQPVMASDDAMICAVTKGVSCFKQSECTEGTATDINMPILMKINPKNNQIISVEEDGKPRISKIKQSSKDIDGRFLIYQGVEEGGAWSAVVDSKTGSMTVALASGENNAYIAYGTCSKSILKTK